MYYHNHRYMIIFTTVMKTLLLSFLLAAGIAISGCADPKTDDPYQVYPQATITHPAGTQWSTSHGYLGLPFSVGKLASSQATCLVVGLPLDVDEQLGIDIIGGIKVARDSTDTMLVLAQPANVDQRSIMIKDLNHFATVHSAAKWQIEQYITHYRGMGSARIVGWEDEAYVKAQLGIQ